ncbi:MAG: 50S ribosomal protein L31e [Candidatus Aenigmarchaeota archaeon]|nr:50S ribosomal protein L31e [Candidatus Aenigmarchaeota archaeon]
MENQVYTIPLRYSVYSSRKYRTRKAMNITKDFLERHLKTSLDKIKIGQSVNEAIWSRGIQKPPSKIKVEIFKEDEIFRVELFGYKPKKEEKKKEEEKEEKKPSEEIKGNETEKKEETKPKEDESQKETPKADEPKKREPKKEKPKEKKE